MKYAISARRLVAAARAAVRAQAPATGTLAADVSGRLAGPEGTDDGPRRRDAGGQVRLQSTPAQRSYGEQILHVAQINMFCCSRSAPGAAAGQPEGDLQGGHPSGAGAVGRFRDGGPEGIQRCGHGAGRRRAALLGRATRARIAYFAMSHAMDIYGQMAVYLRLNDIVPPASRRGV
jgi:hypothetical protein